MQLCFSSLFGNLLRLSVHKTCLLWSHFYSFFKIYLFIFDCTESSLLYLGFLWLKQARATLRCRAVTSLVMEQRLQAPGLPVVGAHRLSSFSLQALELGISSFAQAQLLCGMWNIPRQGIEPMFRALAGGFLFTAPPGNSQFYFFFPVCIPFFPLPYSAGYDLQSAVKYRQQQQTRCLVSILQGKTFSNLPLYMAFTRLRKCPSVPSLLRFFKS